MNQSVFVSRLCELAPRYDAFILDLWGVVHDGQHLYPGTLECLRQLRSQQKRIIFLSNAPRRASAVAEALSRMGLGIELYDHIVTSGETAYRTLGQLENAAFSLAGKHYFYIGLEKDRRILDRLDYTEVPKIQDAQFVLLAHTYRDNQPMGELMLLLQEILTLGLPVICINPDLEVVRLSGERVYCAGLVAQWYEKLGGKVIYFGKPHANVYAACLHLFEGVEKSQILAVGDNLATDIKGANRAGMDCALVTGGVLQAMVGDPQDAEYVAKCSELIEQENVTPQFVLGAFNW